MKAVLVTGGRGTVGRAVVNALWSRGDRVTVLTRDPSKAARMFPREVRTTLWDPLSPGSWEAEVDQVDAVLNLGAAPQFGQSWTTSYKLALLESRVRATENLVAAMAKARRKPTMFVSASATGLYGIDRKGILVIRRAPPGEVPAPADDRI